MLSRKGLNLEKKGPIAKERGEKKNKNLSWSERWPKAIALK